LALTESPFRWRNTTIDLWSILLNVGAQQTEPLRSREMDSFPMTECQIQKRVLSIILIMCHYYVRVKIIQR
jgi:hypothetical protein